MSKKRLQIEFSDKVYGVLEKLKDGLDTNYVGVIRKAVATLDWLYTQVVKEKCTLVLRKPSGEDVEVLLFPEKQFEDG